MTLQPGLPPGVLIDEDDRDRVYAYRWFMKKDGYVRRNRRRSEILQPGEPRKGVQLHRFLTDAPPGTHVDYKNGNPMDNRRIILRVVTPQINQVYRKRLNKNNRSGARGVYLARDGKWCAQIMVYRKTLYLGRYVDIEQVIAARKAAELLYFGEACP